MDYYNSSESREPDTSDSGADEGDAPIETNVAAFTKFSSFTWFWHKQKARCIALFIWSIIVYVMYLIVRSFINGECQNRPSHTMAYGALLVSLVAFYVKIVHKHVSLPSFKYKYSYKDNFNGIGSVYQQMHKLHLEAKEKYNSEETKRNEYVENVKKAFTPGLTDEERRQYYKEILKPIPSEEIKQEYDERTHQTASQPQPINNVLLPREQSEHTPVLRRRIEEEYA
jgi:hypothetical protein